MRGPWVLWGYRFSDQKGKWDKPPLQMDGKHASSTDPATWTTFGAVLMSYYRGGYDGLGVVLDDLAGVDLDDCRDPDTGDIAPWARTIIDELNTYTEISPSGTGVKLLLYGELPPGPRRKDHVEMYSGRGRYFTITGQPLDGTPPTINMRQNELNALHSRIFAESTPHLKANPSQPANLDDDNIIEKASAASNGAKFRALFEGSTTGYQGHSEADLALCMMLAFWTDKDAERMDRLFRRSGLMRGKWDERHYADGKTYGQGTIRKAIERIQQTYRPDHGRWRTGNPQAKQAQEPPPDEPRTVVKAIFAYFQERYRPLFKIGASVWSDTLRRDITGAEACRASTSDLFAALQKAIDFPHVEGLARQSMEAAKAFSRFAPFAWADLIAGLPEQADSPEISEDAGDKFRTVVKAALLHPRTFSVEDKPEARPLIHWCRMWAKPGKWQTVRDLCLWIKLDKDNKLSVAMNVHLFDQIGRRELAPYEQKNFATLCERYDIARDRGSGGNLRFIVFTSAFLNELFARPVDATLDDDDDAEPLCAETSSSSSSSSVASTGYGRSEATGPEQTPLTEGGRE